MFVEVTIKLPDSVSVKGLIELNSRLVNENRLTDRVTEYRSEEAFIMDSKPKFLSILKEAAIRRDNELIQALIRT